MSENQSGAALPESPDTRPPAANQGKDEPIATAPDESPQSSVAETDDDQGATASPGDSKGVPVPSTHAAAGTSEAGVPLPGVVPPGKPDGEVDTRG